MTAALDQIELAPPEKSPAPEVTPPPPPPPAPEGGASTSLASEADDPAALAQRLGVAFLPQLGDHKPSAQFVAKVPIGYARRHRVIGLASDSEALTVAFADVAPLPGAWDCLDVLARWLGRPIEPCLSLPGEIQAAINRAYQERSGQAEALLQTMDRSAVLSSVQRLANREDLLDTASRAPVIQLVNLILFEAVKQLASDVHVQPYEDRLVVRFRIDGVLFDAFELPGTLPGAGGLHAEMVSRIKVMGRMNIAEKRLAQDGRATVQVGDRVIDLRLSSVPTSHGERVVIRLLDKSARLYTLNELGMPHGTLSRFREIIHVEHGLILVTGPTGSGKSTTLYGSLQQLNSKALNILTLEDPIEYQLPGVSQIQVSNKKGMTFASGLRSVLRQDPDIIMVGEIRDHETAVLAIQSALTGHLVFSTLHTNDAASAVTRLLDLGIEPYLVASSLIGVMAQRLVRRVCPACARRLAPQEVEAMLSRLDVDDSDLTSGGGAGGGGGGMRLGDGCDECRRTGFRGRVGIFELLMINDAVRRQVQVRATAADIKAAAIEHGMRTLRDDGVAKMLSGLTTGEEVMRVTMRATQ